MPETAHTAQGETYKVKNIYVSLSEVHNLDMDAARLWLKRKK